MGKGANQQDNGELHSTPPASKRFLGELTWEEVRKHDGKEVKDKWLVIDSQVYDITRWSRRHPGGYKVITHYAGQDATEAFTAFHNDETFVRKYMKAIHIGKLRDEEVEEKDIVKDMEELRKTAEKMGLFNASFFFFFLQVLHILALEAAAYVIMRTYGFSWWTFIVCTSLIATLQAQCGWVQHDFGHLSCFKSTFWNHFFHYFLMSSIKGASAKWWTHMHYQHHAKPNVINKDPDVRLEKLFVVGEKMPITVAESGESNMPFNHQHKYFFIIGPPLLFPVYFQFMIYRHMIKRREWVDLACNLVYYIRFLYCYVPLMTWWQLLLFYETFRVMESIWFTWVSQSNHIPMEIDEDKARPWLELQLHATCNLEKSWFNDWFTGHLNFQIEHHLFPTMPRHNLFRISPYVKSLCKKHNVEYKTKTLLEGFADIIRSLKTSGQIWYDAYYHLQDQYEEK
ncbi:acyl-CoA 6-desaturase-like [Diadema setosum]|uniref:acyl-CoA 6-desaturase-like n=1 Tax=Diadema setosum TaxID=31175 RepID=UPI003B3B9C7A